MDISTYSSGWSVARPALGSVTRGPALEFDAAFGWLVLRDCPLGGAGPRVGLVLLHPDVGVAFVDFSPKATDAAARLRCALDARRFPAIFGGYPPEARAVLPADRQSDLGRVLAAEFKAQPPLALAGGDAWVRSACAAIEAEDPAAVPDSLRARRRAFPWRPAALAGTAGGLVALLMVALGLSGPGPGNPAGPSVFSDAAPGIARPTPQKAASPGQDMTEQDVLAALASANPATAAGGEVASESPEAEAEPAPVAAASEARSGPPSAPAPTTSEPAHAPVHAALEAVPPLPAAAAVAAVDAFLPAPPAPAGTFVPQPQAALPKRAPPAAPASAEARPAQKRPAALAEALPRPRTPSTATSGPPLALFAPLAEAGSGGRCGAILARAMVGEALSDDDREHLRRGCRPRG
jgi:hypothetical protein